MIKNEREYRITKAQADKFERALERLEDTSGETIDPLLLRVQIEAAQSQLGELKKDLAEYDALRSGQYTFLECDLEELPQALIKARIAAALTQKDLAERLRLKEQQIQRYEATDYESASLSRIIEVANALNIRVKHSILLTDFQISLHKVLDRIIEAGVDYEFVVKRLFPRSLVARLSSGESQENGLERQVVQVVSNLSKIFGWPLSAIAGDVPLQFRTDAIGTNRFKVSSKAEAQYLGVYTIYAHHVATLVLETTLHLEAYAIPTSPQEVREAILGTYGDIEFKSILMYVWDLGIPVLPLDDPGAFHGACWRENHRNIIVLKQQNKSLSRWAFDLLHEMYHAGQNPEEATFAHVEPDDKDEDIAANVFAADILLAGRAEELFHNSIKTAHNDLRKLKSAVQRVAKNENLSVAALANYTAFRLSLQNENWWGTAASLQDIGISPFEIARSVLLSKTDLTRLDPSDEAILIRAVSDLLD